MKQTITNLDNGVAVLQVPDKLSKNDVADLRELLSLQLRVFERITTEKTITDTINEASRAL